MKKWCSQFFICSGFLFLFFNIAQANLPADDLSIPLVAGGRYNNSEADAFPMLVASTDGENWDYGIASNHLPTDYVSDSENGFYDVSCTTQICAAVGKYFSGTLPNRNYFPMLAISLDEGATWKYVIDKNNLPDGEFAEGKLEDISCTTSVCVAIGSYRNNLGQYPLLAISQDEGQTWHYKIDSRFVPDDYSIDASFYNVSCKPDICAAVGTYFNGVTNIPLLAMSIDNGDTWTYEIDSNKLPLDFAEYGVFEDVSCNAIDTCVAVGTYESKITGNHYPMAVVTNDRGESWKYQNSAPDDLLADGVFTSVNCATDMCVASGYYVPELGNMGYYPMLAFSTDNGNTWTYGIDSQRNLPSGFSNFGIFTSASCTQSICAASGYYFSNTGSLPLLAMSTDKGSTWTYALTDNLPSNMIILNGVSCAQAVCMAGGEYQVKTIREEVVYPLLAVSTDNGATWNYQIDGDAQLPEDFSSYGTFYGVGAH